MINAIRSRFSVKLFLSYLVIILVGVFVIAFVTQFALPQIFTRHMAGMLMEQGVMQGMNNGRGPGMGAGFMSDFYRNFRATFNDALTLAMIIAALTAAVVSLAFSRRVVAPLRAMMRASQRIAEGHFDERVIVSGSDEFAQLAVRFNSMASQLEEVELRRRQLLGDVSHELRTPLTTIKGSMEGLVDGVLPATPETFEQIQREAERLGRLVDDLQELSRVEAGAYKLDVCLLDISTLAQGVVRRFSLQLEQKNIILTLALPPDIPQVLADEDRVGQILTNLLANAIQYTPAGGTVEVAAVHSGSEVLISVRDSGIGIAPEDLPHIFDRFYRADKSRSRSNGGGSGIGLTVSKHLVEAHGGQIWASSAGEGQGCVFTFSLPVS